MIALCKFELLEAAVSLLYPPICTLCGGKTRAGEYLCEQCEAKTMRIVAPFCQQCSEPFDGAIATVFTCANCAHRTIYFDAAVAAYRGRGIVRQIIHDFKYGRQIHLRHLVARWLCAAFDDERLRGRRVHKLQWPSSKNRQLRQKAGRRRRFRAASFKNVPAVRRSCRRSSSRRTSGSAHAVIIILSNRPRNESRICSTRTLLWKWTPA